MDNIIYERDYREEHRQKMMYRRKHKDTCHEDDIDSTESYFDALEAVPKVINPEEKENYEYLLNRCDAWAREVGGRVRGTVDFRHWGATIEFFLPFIEFASPEQLQLMKEISEKCATVLFEPADEGGLRMSMLFYYFDDLFEDDDLGFILMDAIFKDDALAKKLGIDLDLKPELQESADDANDLLDELERVTGLKRARIFKMILERMTLSSDQGQMLNDIRQVANEILDSYK